MQCRHLTAVQAHSVSKLGASADMIGTVVVDCLHAAVPHSSCKKYAGSSWHETHQACQLHDQP